MSLVSAVLLFPAVRKEGASHCQLCLGPGECQSLGDVDKGTFLQLVAGGAVPQPG